MLSFSRVLLVLLLLRGGLTLAAPLTAPLAASMAAMSASPVVGVLVIVFVRARGEVEGRDLFFFRWWGSAWLLAVVLVLAVVRNGGGVGVHVCRHAFGLVWALGFSFGLTGAWWD